MKTTSPFRGLNKARDTHRTRERLDIALKRAQAARRDGDKRKRRSLGVCVYCYHYAGGLAGQAFTPYECEGCQESCMHHNTAVPRFCPACWEKHRLCSKCGADIDLKLEEGT